MIPEIITTSDGSHSLYVSAIDESYHSTHGAIQESLHIFIENALEYRALKELRVLEIGFGTGLNALLSFDATLKSGTKVHYTTIEKYPVDELLLKSLNYAEQLNSQNLQTAFNQIHSVDWESWQTISPEFEILKLEKDFTDYFPAPDSFDVVYFDAFSPEKQPEMWTENQFLKIYNACSRGAVLTTYCAKGVVRRALQAVGFTVERLPGPPGKREILRAIKL